MSEKVKFKVYGSKEYTLNVLSKHNVTVRFPFTVKDGITFFVAVKDKSKTQKLLQDYGRKYEILSLFGHTTNLKNVAKRYTFFVGLVVGFIVLLAYFSLVADVSVEGNKTIEENVIKNVVLEELKVPSLRLNVDKETIEKRLLTIEGVSYANVTREGKTIKVKIVEELPKINVLDTQNFKSILSTENGTVTKIVVYGGTATVKIGDEVTKNTPLIEPYIVSQIGERKPSLALGKVELKVTRYKEITYADEEEQKSCFPLDYENAICEFKDALKENEEYMGSHFLIKKLDKNIVCSIYYDIIVRIN